MKLTIVRYNKTVHQWQTKGEPIMKEIYKELSQCSNCKSKFLDDGFKYCPQCGVEIGERERP